MGILAAGIVGYLVLIVAGDELLARVAPGSPPPAPGERIALGYAVGAGAVSLLLFWGSLIVPGAVGVAWVTLPVATLVFLRRESGSW
ncbi:MAG TPA: hypothetical protein VIU62_06005, partial [Chloroflexota bacterium]